MIFGPIMLSLPFKFYSLNLHHYSYCYVSSIFVLGGTYIDGITQDIFSVHGFFAQYYFIRFMYGTEHRYSVFISTAV